MFRAFILGVLLLCVANIFAQTSAFTFSAEDTTDVLWVEQTGIKAKDGIWSCFGAVEGNFIDNKSTANVLGGVSFNKSWKQLKVRISPFFFGNLQSATYSHNQEFRLGNLKQNQNNPLNQYRLDGFVRLQYAPIKYVQVEAGRSKFQFGKGINSLLWSGEGPPIWYTRASLKVKQVGYQVQWQMINEPGLVNRKWIANHTLTLYLPKQWKISLYEAVIWAAKDISYNRGFDWQYLAPTVIYRPTEYNGGSSDNVILGLDWSGKLFRKVHTYGQLVVDEFLLDEIRKNDGWWANKFGVQTGLYANFTKWFVQGEINAVRPFTYSHGNTVIAYTNQTTPIGAWSGAGFAEGVLVVKNNLSNKLSLGFMGSIGTYKTMDTNQGGNPFITYNTREKQRGYVIGGEDSYKSASAALSASYVLSKNDVWTMSVWVGATRYNTNDSQVISKQEISPWLEIKVGNALFAKFKEQKLAWK